MAWNPWNPDDDDYDADETAFGGAFRSIFRHEMMPSPFWSASTLPPERDPDEDPFARVEARAEDALKERADSRRYAERREQAQAEAAFAAWLADVRELPEVVS